MIVSRKDKIYLRDAYTFHFNIRTQKLSPCYCYILGLVGFWTGGVVGEGRRVVSGGGRVVGGGGGGVVGRGQIGSRIPLQVL